VTPETQAFAPAVAGALAKLADQLPPERLYALLVFGVVYLDDWAKVMGKEEQTIKNAIAKREIPFVRWGNTTVLRVESLREWLVNMEVKPRGSH
jgi:hypothetical protein